MVELAIETGRLPWEWAQADDKTLVTVLDVLQRKADRKGR